MILYERTYRKMKSALLALPGAPSSARMGEFLASAFEIGNYQSLQDYLNRVETEFAFPEHVEIDTVSAITKLADFGCRGWPASDIVATLMALNYDGLLWDMANDHDDIRGAAVIRFDHVSDRWRAAVEKAWHNVHQYMNVDSLVVDINTIPKWYMAEEFLEIGKHIRTSGMAPLSNDQLNGDLDLVDNCGFSIALMLENILLMTREALPDFHAKLPEESLGWITRTLVLDKNGLRVRCKAENCDFGFDIWFACFEGGSIPRP
jgi:hypothetical protein